MSPSPESLREEATGEQIAELRRRYTALLREIVERTDVLPDWTVSPLAGCACGDKCSTGTTDMEKLSQRVTPVREVQR